MAFLARTGSFAATTLALGAALLACGGVETNPGTTSSSSSSSSSASSASSSSSGTGGSASSSSSGGVAGGGGCGTVGSGGAGGAVDEADPCGSLTEPGAPEVRVAWVTKGDPQIDITTPISLLWGFQYAVRLPPAEASSYLLEHERCEQPAGQAESCSVIELPLPDAECAAAFAPKFGLDISQYLPGDNHYSFTLRLKKGCGVVSQDSFAMQVTYTP